MHASVLSYDLIRLLECTAEKQVTVVQAVHVVMSAFMHSSRGLQSKSVAGKRTDKRLMLFIPRILSLDLTCRQQMGCHRNMLYVVGCPCKPHSHVGEFRWCPLT
jgi:hypothetical protein